MGARAAYIVFDGTTSRLHFDRTAAQTLGRDAALDGAAETLRRVRSMFDEQVAVDDWTGWPQMEGSMFIDLPARRVVWAEMGEAMIMPRVVNRMIEHTWPGWTAVWSPEGTRGVLQLAGHDPDPILLTAEQGVLEDLGRLAADPNDVLAPYPEGDGLLTLSVRRTDGTSVSWHPDGFPPHVAFAGPDAVLDFADRIGPSGGTKRVHQGWTDTGLHLDEAARTVQWWSFSEDGRHVPVFEAVWPGWSVESRGDWFEWHEAVLGGKALRPRWTDEASSILDVVHRERPTPPQGEVTVGRQEPGDRGDEGRGRVRVPAEKVRHADCVSFLVDLRAGARPGPARFVDHEGKVCQPASP